MIDLPYLQIRLWSSPWECRWISIIVIVASRIVTLLTQSINFQDFRCVQTHRHIASDDWSSLFYFLILVKTSFSFLTSVHCSNRKINTINGRSWPLLLLLLLLNRHDHFLFLSSVSLSFSCSNRIRHLIVSRGGQGGESWPLFPPLAISIERDDARNNDREEWNWQDYPFFLLLLSLSFASNFRSAKRSTTSQI